MKRVKIMLAVIAFLTTAGGVLAFKISEAKRSIQICTAPLFDGYCPPQLQCKGGMPIGRRFAPVGPVPICYTYFIGLGGCDQRLCPLQGFTLPE
jgi:hypothetical protein